MTTDHITREPETGTPSHQLSFPHDTPVFRCTGCSIELALQDELVSRSFSGSHGPAYLLRSVINVRVGQQEVKQLLTGKHTIASVSCLKCGAELGWTYFSTPDSSQKYKEGKTIFERDKIYKDNKWMPQ